MIRNLEILKDKIAERSSGRSKKLSDIYISLTGTQVTSGYVGSEQWVTFFKVPLPILTLSLSMSTTTPPPVASEPGRTFLPLFSLQGLLGVGPFWFCLLVLGLVG